MLPWAQGEEVLREPAFLGPGCELCELSVPTALREPVPVAPITRLHSDTPLDHSLSPSSCVAWCMPLDLVELQFPYFSKTEIIS